MITLNEIKQNKEVTEFINQSQLALLASEYTDHGINHVSLVSERARSIARQMGMSLKDQELCAIAGYCHDMGSFLSRSHHHYFGALLFHQIFHEKMAPKELCLISQAISNHDKEEMSICNPIAAVLILADKSDVRRSRVLEKRMEKIKGDIHDRVNYATKESDIVVNRKKKNITLKLKIDTNFVPVIEYFQIFTARMIFCMNAAKFLGYKFGLVINNFKLL
ncbi:MAG: HD domain-containing protein [Candidatus Pacebacteria bacterium]|nr:HD domain-containing protein [Candidatus Paceibacterota bacterium]